MGCCCRKVLDAQTLSSKSYISFFKYTVVYRWRVMLIIGGLICTSLYFNVYCNGTRTARVESRRD